MYRQSIVSISAPESIYRQIYSQIQAFATIDSERSYVQTILFSVNRPVGFLYIQIDNRTALRMAIKQNLKEYIDEHTGEVTYVLENDQSYRFGKPPVYYLSTEMSITAVRYQELLKLSPYESHQKKEITFTDKATQRKYVMIINLSDGTESFMEISKSRNESYGLPDYLTPIVYSDEKYIIEYENVQAKWREKQEADLAAKKAAIQEKRAKEEAVKKAKKAEQRAAKKAAEKAKKKTTAKTTKTKTTKTKTTKPAASKPKKEETITEMWKNWAKDR